MSERQQEATFNQIPTALKSILHLWTKDYLHTALPGLIETYDPAKRRARVQPALRLILDDGSTLDRPPLVNVPILFPSGGGFSFTFPLAQGDPVLLLFSERGIAAFKTNYALSNPDAGRFFSQSDAMALAGFGPLALTPATRTGSAWQTEDGNRSIRLERDSVEVHVGARTSILVTDDSITFNAPDIYHNGRVHGVS